MVELKLSDFGLETTEEAAARREQTAQTVRKLVATGRVPAVVIGSGRSAKYLVRPADVDAVPVLPKGRPTLEPKKEAAQKPKKTRGSEKSRKKKSDS